MTAELLIGILPDPPRACVEAPTHALVAAGSWTGLSLTVSPQEAEDEAKVLQWASRQNAILGHYVETCDVLPMALGAVFTDSTAVRDHILKNDAYLRTEAQRLAGFCEYSLHITVANPPVQHAPTSPVETGKAFLTARKARRDTKNKQAAERANLVKSAVEAAQQEAAQVINLDRREPGRVMDLAMLVARDFRPTLIKTLHQATLGAAALGLVCKLVGPCPAYSFVNRDEAA